LPSKGNSEKGWKRQRGREKASEEESANLIRGLSNTEKMIGGGKKLIFEARQLLEFQALSPFLRRGNRDTVRPGYPFKI